MLMTYFTSYFNLFLLIFFPSNAFNASLDTYSWNITVWQPFLTRPHILRNCHKTSNREWELEVMERNRGFKGQSASEAYEDWWFMVKCVWPTLLLIFLFAALEHAQKKKETAQKKGPKKGPKKGKPHLSWWWKLESVLPRVPWLIWHPNQRIHPRHLIIGRWKTLHPRNWLPFHFPLLEAQARTNC